MDSISTSNGTSTASTDPDKGYQIPEDVSTVTVPSQVGDVRMDSISTLNCTSTASTDPDKGYQIPEAVSTVTVPSQVGDVQMDGISASNGTSTASTDPDKGYHIPEDVSTVTVPSQVQNIQMNGTSTSNTPPRSGFLASIDPDKGYQMPGAVSTITKNFNSNSIPKVSDCFLVNSLLLNHVMKYTNPLLGLTSSRIATTSAKPSILTPAESSTSVPASLDSLAAKTSEARSEALSGASATSDSALPLGKPQLEGSISKSSVAATGKGGTKKAQKMRPSKTSTAR